jgi:hypothetical protein
MERRAEVPITNASDNLEGVLSIPNNPKGVVPGAYKKRGVIQTFDLLQ